MAMDNALRYTRLLAQEARNWNEMGRQFYVAGGEVDGSVIQQCPGSEIMVVDFEKDELLRHFYDDTMKVFDESKADSQWLPGYFKDRIRHALEPDVDFVEGLIDGITQEKDRRNFVRKCPPLKNEKIYVGEYLRMGKGVCRQMWD